MQCNVEPNAYFAPRYIAQGRDRQGHRQGQKAVEEGTLQYRGLRPSSTAGDPNEGGKLAVIQVVTAVTLVVICLYCSW